MIVGAKGLKRVFMFGKFRSKKSTVASSVSKKISKSNNSTIGTNKKTQKSRANGTSGSDVSVIRNEHTSNGQNRNSSSG